MGKFLYIAYLSTDSRKTVPMHVPISHSANYCSIASRLYTTICWIIHFYLQLPHLLWCFPLLVTPTEPYTGHIESSSRSDCVSTHCWRGIFYRQSALNYIHCNQQWSRSTIWTILDRQNCKFVNMHTSVFLYVCICTDISFLFLDTNAYVCLLVLDFVCRSICLFYLHNVTAQVCWEMATLVTQMIVWYYHNLIIIWFSCKKC